MPAAQRLCEVDRHVVHLRLCHCSGEQIAAALPRRKSWREHAGEFVLDVRGGETMGTLAVSAHFLRGFRAVGTRITADRRPEILRSIRGTTVRIVRRVNIDPSALTLLFARIIWRARNAIGLRGVALSASAPMTDRMAAPSLCASCG